VHAEVLPEVIAEQKAHVNQENQSVKKTLVLLVRMICLSLIPGAAKEGNLTLLGATSNAVGGSTGIDQFQI
jgi:hypothetical protein